MTTEFEAGQLVVKILHGSQGYREETVYRIAKIEGDAIYLGDGESGYDWGITYDPATGREIEMFFAAVGIWSEIRPATGADESLGGFDRASEDHFEPDGE